ncbi:MAG TPA: hypothetical protein DHU96_08810 [Actinobacteria bacterium]|nr:hypothetical protein [Actinomycetota bacterium]
MITAVDSTPASAMRRIAAGVGAQMAFTARRRAAAAAPGLLAAGLGLLFLTAKGPAVWLGLFAVLWYNGVYTRLKRITASAALPGALCGAIPPLMGWTCAGGGLAAPRIVLFSGILVLWQLPHFWLFAIKYREDFKKAGFPPLFPQLTEVRLRLIILAWVLSAAASTLLLGAFGMLAGIEAKALCLVAVCWIFASVGRAMLKGGGFFYSGKVFFRLNLFMGLTIGSVVLDRLLASLPF